MITVHHTERCAGQPRLTHIWRERGNGEPRSAVDLGQTWLTFETADEARALAAECLKAADAMDALPAAPEGGQE